MPNFQTQGLSACYTETGCGPTVVLLHAGGSSSAQWRKISPFLEETFRLVAPDLIGFGETGPLPDGEPLSHDHQADLAADLIAQVADGCAHLVGHSYGGASALRLAINCPALIDRLVLIEPIVTPLLQLAGDTHLYEELEQIARQFFDASSGEEKETAWTRFIDYRNSPGTWAGLSQNARDRFLGQTAQVTEGFRSNLDNPTTFDELEQIEIPVLVLCGRATTEPDRRIAQILREHVPGCTYGSIPGAEHMSPLTHPGPVAGAIADFFHNAGG